MADTQWLTQAQYDLLANELKERVEVKRVEIARLIDAARQEGDLRENGGYHAARNEQSMNETRIQALQAMLEHAEVGETPADDGIVEPVWSSPPWLRAASRSSFWLARCRRRPGYPGLLRSGSPGCRRHWPQGRRQAILRGAHRPHD